MTGEYEPSSALLDLTFQQAFYESLVYIPWNQCTSRSMEVLHVRKDPSLQKNLRADRDGNLRYVEDVHPLDQDVSSEIKLHFALHRRGLAYAAANLLDFE
eukprot:1750555-Amphidinium_carterae.1